MTPYHSDWVDDEISLDESARPIIVCLCGSTRFYDAFRQANYDETMAGKIVLTVGHYPHTSTRRVIIDGCMGQQECDVEVVNTHSENVGCTPEKKIELDKLHFKKIELADEVLILNVGGYIGQSTRNELQYAQKLLKTIRYLENPA